MNPFPHILSLKAKDIKIFVLTVTQLSNMNKLRKLNLNRILHFMLNSSLVAKV